MATKQEGYLIVDHRNSPGIPAAHAERIGVDPKLLGEGGIFEAATKRCCHCACVVVLNPCRVRPRTNCPKCDEYVCDECVSIMREPGYVHRSFAQIVDMVKSGKWEIGPGSTSRRVNLIPTIGALKDG